MSNQEIETVAQRVAEILRQDSKVSAEVSNGCSMAGPSKQAINEKLIDEIVNTCQNAIIHELHSDEEQFVAVGKLRERICAYWDEQLRTSNEVSSVNDRRAGILGKLIDMTISR